jgi:hypothetical protein
MLRRVSRLTELEPGCWYLAAGEQAEYAPILMRCPDCTKHSSFGSAELAVRTYFEDGVLIAEVRCSRCWTWQQLGDLFELKAA